jgi:hypothetical protein
MDTRKVHMLASALACNVSLQRLVLNKNPLGADNVVIICDAILAGMVMLRDVVPVEIDAQAGRAASSKAPAVHARLDRMRAWRGLQTLSLCCCDIAVNTVTLTGMHADRAAKVVSSRKALDALGALVAHPACTLKRINISKNKLSGTTVCLKLSPYGKRTCACAQRPGLPQACGCG